MEDDREFITLIDDDGNETELELIMPFEHGDKVYMAFIDADTPEDAEEAEVRIMRVEGDADSEEGESYVDVDDENELNEVFQVFLDIMEQDGEEE